MACEVAIPGILALWCALMLFVLLTMRRRFKRRHQCTA